MFWVKRSANLIALFNTFMASMEAIIQHPICCLLNSECSSYETAEVQILQNTRQRQSSFQNKNGKLIMRAITKVIIVFIPKTLMAGWCANTSAMTAPSRFKPYYLVLFLKGAISWLHIISFHGYRFAVPSSLAPSTTASPEPPNRFTQSVGENMLINRTQRK